MPDVTLKPSNLKPMFGIGKKTTIIIIIILLLSLGIVGFLVYRWYEDKQFSNNAIPIFKASVSLSKNIERIERKYISTVSHEELKEIADTAKSMKLRVVEITVRTKSSSDTQDALILMIETQEDRLDCLISSIDDYTKKKNETDSDLNGSNFDKVIFQNYINEDPLINQRYEESLTLYEEYRRQILRRIMP